MARLVRRGWHDDCRRYLRLSVGLVWRSVSTTPNWLSGETLTSRKKIDVAEWDEVNLIMIIITTTIKITLDVPHVLCYQNCKWWAAKYSKPSHDAHAIVTCTWSLCSRPPCFAPYRHDGWRHDNLEISSFTRDNIFRYQDSRSYRISREDRCMQNIKTIDQFRYIKIQPKTIDLSTRLGGINPTNSVFIPQSLFLRSIVLGWILIYRKRSI